jgi:hypothetical protein
MLTTGAALAALGDLIATGKEFDPAACFIGVFTAITDAGPATTLGNLTLPSGALATAVAPASVGSPYPLNNGAAAVDYAEVSLAPTMSDAPATCLGWYVASLATSGTLKKFDYLSPPVTLTVGGAPLNIVLRLQVDPRGQWDVSVVWNG